jgi:RES domain-containing protein
VRLPRRWLERASVARDVVATRLRTVAWACRSEGLPSETAADLISDKPNRWSVQGEPTIYLSGDPALALVEAGRHPDDVVGQSKLIEVELEIPLAVDLRDSVVSRALGLPEDTTWVLDRGKTRDVARSLRHSGICDAILVPSAGALDQPNRWNAVVFGDDPRRIGRMVGRPRAIGLISIPTERADTGDGGPLFVDPPRGSQRRPGRPGSSLEEMRSSARPDSLDADRPPARRQHDRMFRPRPRLA